MPQLSERFYAEPPVAPGGRNVAAASLAGKHIRNGKSMHETMRLVWRWNRSNPVPLSEDEVKTIVASVANTHIRRNPAAVIPITAQDREDLVSTLEPADAPDRLTIRERIQILSADRLAAEAPELRPVVIDGILRRGEVANLIAAPKTGKSWAVHNLALTLATGGEWFGYKCVQTRALIIDNELHRETLSSRLAKVAEVYGLAIGQLREWVDVMPLRGNLRDLDQLHNELKAIPRGTYGVIVIDSLYRAIPKGCDENANADITHLYNDLDRYAAMLDAAFVVIHHTSKGVQGDKAITDVGAGAGAQARAADSHLTLRQHEEPDAVVLDAVVRSFPPPSPSCWRFEVPTFTPAPDLDPTKLRTLRRRKDKTDESGTRTKPEPWTPERFAERFITDKPRTMDGIMLDAVAEGVSHREGKRLVKQAADAGLIVKCVGRGNQPTTYSSSLMQNANAEIVPE
jgi:hypothetical protein